MTHIEREKRVVELMIKLYCRNKEGNREYCKDCLELIQYCHKRLDNCKFGERKPSCKKCPIHCYKTKKREKIRKVMRYAGPRMILHSPIVAIRHLLGV